MTSISEINSIRNRMGHIEILERQMTATAAVSITERDRTTEILRTATSAYNALMEPAAAILRRMPDASNHPLWKESDTATAVTAYLLIGTDRVLCGTHNEDIFFKAVQTKRNTDKLFVIGSQITDLAQSLHMPVAATFPSTSPEETTTLTEFAPVATTLLAKHAAGEIHRAYAVFKEEHGISLRQIIPIPHSDIPKASDTSDTFNPTFEPDNSEMLDWILHHLVLYGIYTNYLTSAIQEFSARLKTASTAKIGAKQLHEELDVAQNTLRRAQITEQIIELEDITPVRK